ncbi:hypothetical protein P3X46_014607 [Hevea brasiliensis]|uniref:Uncharacterized protein n=1 Tax=Hevea brasiliensis TaxID=3981 RepID=A0ABQ9LT84_HEVBR|nr:hypothetical protein P3X46_014607 [Hevea brasiliensis]
MKQLYVEAAAEEEATGAPAAGVQAFVVVTVENNGDGNDGSAAWVVETAEADEEVALLKLKEDCEDAEDGVPNEKLEALAEDAEDDVPKEKPKELADEDCVKEGAAVDAVVVSVKLVLLLGEENPDESVEKGKAEFEFEEEVEKNKLDDNVVVEANVDEINKLDVVVAVEAPDDPKRDDPEFAVDEAVPNRNENELAEDDDIPNRDGPELAADELFPNKDGAELAADELPTRGEGELAADEVVPNRGEGELSTDEAMPNRGEAELATEETVPNEGEAELAAEETVPKLLETEQAGQDEKAENPKPNEETGGALEFDEVLKEIDNGAEKEEDEGLGLSKGDPKGEADDEKEDEEDEKEKPDIVAGPFSGVFLVLNRGCLEGLFLQLIKGSEHGPVMNQSGRSLGSEKDGST